MSLAVQKMKIYWKPLQFSLLIHGIILLGLINLHMSPVRPQNILVVDFSMDNEPILRNGGRAPAVSLTINQNKNQKNRHAVSAVQHRQHEEQQPIIPPESLHAQDVTEKEPQAAVMTVTEDDITTKMGSNDFSLFNSQSSISESGFRESGLSGHVNLVRGDPISSVKSRYIKTHFSYIKDLIHKHLVYPAQAKKMGWEGKVITSFIISSAGCAKEVKISKSSGHEVLDESAIKAINNASPFPKPPVEAQIIIPIIYRLN